MRYKFIFYITITTTNIKNMNKKLNTINPKL